MEKLDFMKMKTFCSVKDTVKRMKRSQPERKYLQNTYLIKDLYPKYIENSENSAVKNQTTQLKNR